MQCASFIKTCRDCEEPNDGKQKTCPKCGADLRCTREAVNGYTRCPNHGGPVPARNFYGKGNMTTGSGSSFPLMRLAARYNKMMQDGKVLSNRAAIDVIDKRITQLLERVDLDEAPDRLARLSGLWNEYMDAKATKNTVEVLKIEGQIDHEFEKVYHDYMAWKQIFEALDLRGKSVEREIKTLREIKAIMTAEDGYHLASKLLAAVVRVIGDEPKKIKQVQYEFTRIIGESSDNVIEGDGEDVGADSEADGGTQGSGDVDQAELLHPRDET